jgi:hypothetical protein
MHAPRPDCAICLQTIAPPTKYNIGCNGNHVFHKTCINGWFLNQNDTCPLCRDPVSNPLPIIKTSYYDDTRQEDEDIVLDLSGPSLAMMGNHIRRMVENDETMRVSLYFFGTTITLDNIIFWNRDENDVVDDDDYFAYVYVDGLPCTMMHRWW